MADTYTTALKARKVEQGAYTDAWAPKVNDDALELLDDAIAGVTSINLGVSTSYSLAALGNGADSESRAMRLYFTGTPASAVTVTVPASVTSKLYIVDNACGQALTIKYAATAGVTVTSGGRQLVWCDGTSVGTIEAGYRQTAAELGAGVTPTNFAYPPGHVYRYGTNTTPGTTDMTTALNASLLQAYQGGADPYWPAGTYAVSTLTISSPVRIRTDGYATIIQHTATAADTQCLKVQSSDVTIEEIYIKGKIATASSEHNHGIILGGTAANARIKLHGVKFLDIRGDGIYFGGTPTFPLSAVEIGHVYGSNIYRNLIGFVGCSDVRVKSITGTAIGYRLFDVEPNAGSNESPTGIRIDYVRGSNLNFAGDPSIPNGSIDIGYCELDNSLHADSTPGYPTHPSSAGNIACILSNTRSLHFGTLKVRGYGERVINDTGSTVKCRLVIDYFDCDTSNTTEPTFKTLIEGSTMQSLTINGGVVVLQGTDRYICKDVTCYLRNLTVSGGCVAASADYCEIDNITYDGTGVSSNIFSDIDISSIRRFIATNASSATFMASCEDNCVVGCSGTFSAINTGGGVQLYQKCTLNSTTYELRSDLQGSKTFDPGSLTDGSETFTDVTVSGAVMGDFATGSHSTDALGVKISAQVVSSNTVRVFFHNKTGSTQDITSGTTRARVWKQ